MTLQTFHGAHDQKRHGRKRGGAQGPYDREVALNDYAPAGELSGHADFVRHGDLNREDNDALAIYVGGANDGLGRDYKKRNKDLREGLEPEASDIALTNAIEKGELSEDVVLYRGVTGDIADQMISGERSEFTDLRFMSTTSDFEYAKEWAAYHSTYETNAVMRVHARRGTKAVSWDVAYGVPDSLQSEVIIQRGTSFRVRDVNTDFFGDGWEQHIVDVEVIGQGAR